MRGRLPGALRPTARLLLLLFPLAAACVSLVIGRVSLPFTAPFTSLLGHLFGTFAPDAYTEKVLWTLRLPRILLSLLCGAGLSVAGCAFQALFANPLATPDTLGVASGAGFGAALGLLLGLGALGTQAMALAFGLAAVGLTYLAGLGRDRGRSSTVLAGIMIGSLFSALIALVKFVADPESQLPEITYWLMGSLSGRGYASLLLGAPLLLAGLITLYLLRWRLNLLSLSEDEARTSGTDIRMLRGVTVLCATAMTAACVSLCGQVGWVGLLVPHAARLLFGSNHVALVPASACLGAGFLVLVDTAARSATAAELPISLLTALIGAPFFILLLRRRGGWQL